MLYETQTMHNPLFSLMFIVLLSSCAQPANQKVQLEISESDALQQQFDIDRADCWVEIKEKYDCFPPVYERTFIRGQEDIYKLFMESKRYCNSDGINAQHGGSEKLIRLINYMGHCLTKKNWSNLWCCDQY